MSFWVDSHAHIYLGDFDQDRSGMLARSIDHGIERIYMPNVDHQTIDAMMEVESKYPEQCFATMGLHPCSVKKNFELELYTVEEWLSKRKFSAIGEIGTDLYWDQSFWEQQQEAFRVQLAWAKQYELPVIIHCRESLDQTIDIVEKHNDEKLTGVFHCFTGAVSQAERIIKAGFFLGIGGVATFKKGGLDEVLPEIDLSNIVLETDSPYLAPVPHRGKRNEPSFIPLIAHRMAEIMNVSLEEVKKSTTQNAMKLFNSQQTYRVKE